MGRDERMNRTGQKPVEFQMMMDEALVPDRPSDVIVMFIPEEIVIDFIYKNWADKESETHILLKRFCFSPFAFKRMLKAFNERVEQYKHAFPRIIPEDIGNPRDQGQRITIGDEPVVPEYSSGCLLGHTKEEILMDIVFANHLDKTIAFENRFAFAPAAFARAVRDCNVALKEYERINGELDIDDAPRIIRPDGIQVPQ